MTTGHQLYEVWYSRGDGLLRGPKFKHLADAAQYVREQVGKGSYAVRAPNGRWLTAGVLLGLAAGSGPRPCP